MTGAAQGTPEWLSERRTVIGSSDAAATLGLSAWGTPLSVYMDKRGEADPVETTVAMRRGKAMEPVILDLYAEETGATLDRSPPMWRHKLHSWMGASFDALVDTPEKAQLVEAKSVSYFAARSWGAPGTDQIPDYYLIQVQHQLEVLHSICPWADPVAHVVALVEGEDAVRIYPVARDPDLAASIVRIEGELWRRIEAGDPPPPSTGAEVELLVGRSKPVVVEACPELVAAWEELVAVRAQAKELDDRKSALEDQIKLALGAADTLASGSLVLATWRTSKAAKRLDAKSMAAAHPEIAERFMVEGKPARPFLVKERK